MVILFFVVIAVMRVVQRISGKKASALVNDRATFFEYGAYYQAISAALAVIYLCFVGFRGFDIPTLICAGIAALFFAVELYASIEAIKGCSLVVNQMVASGGLLVPCVAGIFLFDEPMGIWQWLGLALFFLSVYLLASDSKKENKTFTAKTLLMLLLTFIAEGAIMLVQKYFAIYSPNGNVGLYSALTFGLNAAFLLTCRLVLLLQKSKAEGEEGKRLFPLKKMDNKLFLYGGLLAVALFTINQLVTTMAKTVPSAVLFTVSSALSILITCIVGATIFKEKITVKKIIGMLVGFVAIVIVSVL